MTDPLVKRGTVRTTIGVEVDSLDVSLLCSSDSTIKGIPAAQFAAQGGFDGARLALSRDFADGWTNSSCGSLNLFTGRVGEVTVTGTQIDLKIYSDLELLNIQMPRNLFQAGCLHTLYDGGCNLSASAFTVTGNTTANSTRNAINSNLAQAAGYFDQGTIKFVSGQNNGEIRTVKAYANGTLTTIFPFPYAPVTGDHFQAKPGCDKTLATCTATFNNANNFRGFPTIPSPEASY
jgi:uncharacterized phage protein (TIGR02218 family)